MKNMFRFLYCLILINIALIPNQVFSNDIPGFKYLYDRMELCAYTNNNILITTPREVISYDIKKRALNTSVKIDPFYNNFPMNVDDNFTVYGKEVLLSNGKIINISGKEPTYFKDWRKYSLLLPLGDGLYTGLIGTKLYKIDKLNDKEEVIYDFDKGISNYVTDGNKIAWIDYSGKIRFNFSPKIIDSKLLPGWSKFHLDSNYILIYDENYLYIYNIAEDKFDSMDIEIDELKFNNSNIYILNDLGIININLKDKLNTRLINLFGNKVQSFCIKDDDLIILNDSYQLVRISDEKAEHVTDLNIGNPIYIKMVNGKLVVLCTILNGYQLTVYDRNNRAVFEDFFTLEQEQGKNLPFYIDGNRVYYAENDNDKTIRILNLDDLSIKWYKYDMQSRIKFISSFKDNLYIYNFDSTLYTIDLSTDIATSKIELKYDFDLIQPKNENEFWYIEEQIGDHEYEVGTFNIKENNKKEVLDDWITIYDNGLNYLISFDKYDQYILATDENYTYEYDIPLAQTTTQFSNFGDNRTDRITIMPYKIGIKNYFVFYSNGEILNYDDNGKEPEKKYLNTLKAYSLEDTLRLLPDDLIRLTACDIDVKYNKYVFNEKGNIVFRGDLRTSVVSQNYLFKKEYNSFTFNSNEKVLIPIDRSSIINNINLFDLSGNKISGKIIKTDNCIEIRDLPVGVYFLIIDTSNSNECIKFIVY